MTEKKESKDDDSSVRVALRYFTLLPNVKRGIVSIFILDNLAQFYLQFLRDIHTL